MVVVGNRLIRHHYEHCREIEREEFGARSDGTLAVLGRLPKEGGGFTTPPVAIFTKEAGSDAQLATELRSLFAETTMGRQAESLLHAIFMWANQHSGALPQPRHLLPSGAFWDWEGAPRLTNAVSGGPMVLGDEPGNFDYASSGNVKSSYRVSISIHRGYGFPDLTQVEEGN